MSTDVVWFVSTDIAVKWEEPAAFLWWFKVRQVAKCYEACDPRSAQWSESCRRIHQHVPFYPSLDLVCLDTPASLGAFVDATRQLPSCLKRRARLAVPLPPLCKRPLVQQFCLEELVSILPSEVLACPPLIELGARRELRIRAWASFVMRSVTRTGDVHLRMYEFSEQDMQLLYTGSFLRPWVQTALEEAVAGAERLFVYFFKLRLPSCESLVLGLFQRMLRSRTATEVFLYYQGAAWVACEQHCRLFSKMRRAILVEPHAFQITVSRTHYGKTLEQMSATYDPVLT